MPSSTDQPNYAVAAASPLDELPIGLEALREIALDLRWTWSHAGDDLWGAIDAETWALTRNPWLVLQMVPRARLDRLAVDGDLRRALDRVGDERRAQLGARAAPTAAGAAPRRTVGYFSMEYGLGAALPLYAGGLGILAGDHLKAASDVGVPIAAVGLLYQEGYFRQLVDADGTQEALYPYNDPTTLPIEPQLARGGGWLTVSVELPGRSVWLRVWRAVVGTSMLYLLDSNDPLNAPADRGITGKLYDSGNERRLRQEIVLGIGGFRALEALGIDVGVCHLNEGHAAFVVLERARSFMRRTGQSFRAALWATRAGNLFTTHTPVAAGFDAFEPALMAKYFPDGRGYLAELGLPLAELMALGRVRAGDAAEPFRPAYLAVRCAARVNAVSALHAEVSRRLLAPLFPRRPAHEVPVVHVTNGVHTPSWDSRFADELWTRACGKDRWRGPIGSLEAAVASLSDEDLWTARASARHDLVRYARARVARQLGQRGEPPETASRASSLLDPDVLTLGFARRFATYKRPNLLLRQPERLRRLLMDAARPVQLVVAGKAHPADEAGQALIAEWVRFLDDPAIHARAVFLEDYDISMAQEMVQGVDVWINTPRRPFEACGTSGMKVLVNGGLNLSIRDGWWAEAFAPDVGWAVGDGTGDGAAGEAGEGDDAGDTESLYATLERDVVPLFYDRDGAGIPRRWLGKVRASLARLAPRFSASRMVREYDERLYRPAEAALAERTADGGVRGAELAAWEDCLRAHAGEGSAVLGLRWGRLAVRADGAEWDVEVEVYLDDLRDDDVAVELYADPSAGAPPLAAVRAAMAERRSLSGTAHGRVYGARVAADRPADAFTPRIVPGRADVAAAETPIVLWYR